MKKNKHIVGIWGVPRSGTTWLGQIFNSSLNTIYRYQPLFSYSFKSFLDEDSNRLKIDEFFDKIYKTTDPFINHGILNEDKKLNFKKNKKTHLIFKNVRYLHIIENLIKQNDKIKIIGLVRNPCAIISSWINAPKEFDKNWNYLDEWYDAQSKNQNKIEEFYGFKKWKEATFMFHELKIKFPQNFYLVSYESLVDQPLKTTKDIFSFVNLEIDNQVIKFLDDCHLNHSKNVYSVFKDKSVKNKWKDCLDNKIINNIYSELKNTELEEYLV